MFWINKTVKSAMNHVLLVKYQSRGAFLALIIIIWTIKIIVENAIILVVIVLESWKINVRYVKKIILYKIMNVFSAIKNV